MKCRLCGQPTAGPDKLCGDCARALRRAREGSAAVRNVPMSPASRADAAVATVAPRPLMLTSAPAPGWRRRVAWAAVGLVAIGIVYLAQREPDRRHASDAVVVVDRSLAPLAERSDVDSVPGSTPLETLPSTARVKTAGVPAPSAARATPRVPARANAGTTGAKVPTNLEPGSGSSPYTPAIEAAPRKPDGGTQSETEASQQLARASFPQSAATADGAQALAGALEKCGEEKFLAGVICEQKARLRYCDGKWGQVPQCTSRPRAD